VSETGSTGVHYRYFEEVGPEGAAGTQIRC
jgi:hypothetical protein